MAAAKLRTVVSEPQSGNLLRERCTPRECEGDPPAAGQDLASILGEGGGGLELLLAHLSEAVFATGPDGLVQYVCPRFSKYTGLSREAALGLGWARAIHPADRDRVLASWAESVCEGTAHEIDLRVRSELRAYRWFRRRCTPVHAPDGRLRGWFGLLTDIDDLKLATNRLARREARLRAIMDAVPDAMVVINGAGEIEQLNRGAEELFQRSCAEVRGRSIKEVMPSGIGAITEATVDGAAPVRKRRTVSVVRQDGTAPAVEMSVGTARFGAGRVHVAFLQDLSDRRSTELQLRELQRAMAHAARLSALGQMASTLAHELNQPLTAAANYAQAACTLVASSDRASLGKARKVMTSVGGEIARAGQIVRRLRQFVSRGDTDRKAEDLREVLEEAAALALTGARQAGVMVRLSLGPAGAQVLIDRIQIQQVVVNLLRNALEAVSAAPWKEVGLALACEEPGYAVVSVEDTGRGVSPEIAPGLFTPFVSDKPDGMGVGLSISRTIVEAHGGRIWTEPRCEGGTLFKFSLPLIPSPRPDE